jgi:hypothetical protein
MSLNSAQLGPTPKNQIQAMCTYKKRCSTKDRINNELMKKIETQVNYWREVLKTVIQMMIFIVTEKVKKVV